MKTRKKLIALGLMLCMLLSCAACGGPSDSRQDSPQNSQPNTSQNTQTPAPKDDAPSGNTGDLSRIVVIAQSLDITSLDPHGHNDVQSGDVTRMLYDNLVRLDTNNEFVPMLAESWTYLDANTVEIKLKPNVPFHDGHVLNAEDVKFSLEREMQSGFSSHLLTMITNIDVVDDLTLKLTVTDDSAALMSSLSHLCSAIVPKEYTEKLEAEGKTLSEFPCGTGPYYYDYWRVGSECQILRFADYYDEDYKAKNEGLLFKYIAEANSRVIALETGEVDIVLQVPSTSVSSLEANSDIKLLRYDSTDLHYISPNCSKAPFDNELLRQAVAHCIDRDAIIQVQCSGNAKPNYATIGLAAIGYSDPAVKYEYSIEKAKEKLAEAGYSDGFTFTLSVLGENNSRAAQVVQASCAQAGITVNIEILENSAMVAKCGGAESEAGLGWWVANAEPDNTYSPWFSRSLIGAGGYNWSSYDSDEIETLMAQALRVSAPAERQAFYSQINDFVSEHAIVWPLYSEDGMVATRANVDGIVLYSIVAHLYQGITIAE